MKRAFILFAAPLLLTACIEKNPIDENAAKVWAWYSGLYEKAISQDVAKECSDAVMAEKTSDPACETFANEMTQKLNADAVLNEQVKPENWYSKNFWAKWQADFAERQKFKEQYDKLNKDNPWGRKKTW